MRYGDLNVESPRSATIISDIVSRVLGRRVGISAESKGETESTPSITAISARLGS